MSQAISQTELSVPPDSDRMARPALAEQVETDLVVEAHRAHRGPTRRPTTVPTKGQTMMLLRQPPTRPTKRLTMML